MRRNVGAAFALLLAVAGCSSEEPRPNPPRPVAAAAPPAPVRTPIDQVVQLVPLDALDGAELSPEVAAKVRSARAHVPAELTDEQRAALEDLESRSEGLEAEAPPEERPAVLATYYWERLRLFDASLDRDVPPEIASAFANAAYRRD